MPIAPGVKFPKLKDWQSVEVTPARLERWLSNGHAAAGVGVRTATTPAIDIDVLDERVALEMDAWCQAHVGFAPVRVGRAPKRLLVYRADAPFPKQTSVWVDRQGREHRLEVLGEGQQFVAHHVHPDTGRPYEWLGRDDLLTTPHDDLEVLTLDLARAAVRRFEELAAAAGWTRKAGQAPDPRAVAVADEDALAYARDPVAVDDAVLRSYLMAIPNDGNGEADYDTWASVGMALHHQYGGTDDGLELWREWSAQAGKHDDDYLDRKWRGFKDDRGTRGVITARHILHLGRAASQAVIKERIGQFKQAMQAAGTLDDLRAAAKAVSETPDLDALGREALEGALRAAFRRIEGGPMTAPVARGMLKYKPADDAMPNWLRGWVYVTADDTFYQLDTGDRVSRQGFDAKFDRYMLTTAERAEGKTTSSQSATDFALKVQGITVGARLVYLPNEGQEFMLSGRTVFNAYSALNVPEIPEPLSAQDRQNVLRVQRHFETLVPDERERGLFLSWLAYIAQTRSRVNWAVLLQGTEADGKSFLTSLMGAVHGADNVKTIPPQVLGSEFNGWAEGSLVAIVEEVKLQGHNRHDVLNSVKPLITNPVIAIRRMRQDVYQIPNTQSYILLSNYTDALPLSEGDSRYFVINSRFQHKEALLRWKAANPDHYERLFKAVDQSPGALRQWLLTYPLHPEFDPRARAPWSAGRDYMVVMSASEENDGISVALKESLHPLVSSVLLCQATLADEIERLTETVLPSWKFKRHLPELGFTYLGRFWLAGRQRKVWSREPGRFKSATPGQYDRAKLEAWCAD